MLKAYLGNVVKTAVPSLASCRVAVGIRLLSLRLHCLATSPEPTNIQNAKHLTFTKTNAKTAIDTTETIRERT